MRRKEWRYFTLKADVVHGYSWMIWNCREHLITGEVEIKHAQTNKWTPVDEAIGPWPERSFFDRAERIEIPQRSPLLQIETYFEALIFAFVVLVCFFLYDAAKAVIAGLSVSVGVAP